MQKPVPHHLKKYVVEQTKQEYTPEDQAVWRYIMRQLRSHLSIHAHDCYVDGLAKTGIDIDSIPRIDVMNEKLQEFGWGVVPVSGFIPPAVFMEFQSLSYLPIATDMRSIEHILYTPAPDIVHEAAGHAPILIAPSFANYLKEYAQVARKAIISHEDLEVYKAIRNLSDIKEHPDSTPEQVGTAEHQLEEINSQVSYVSEASLLGRMNWWTAEYGLIGSMKSPKIFGAGLLSSIGESQNCLKDRVTKIPLSIDCIDYSYDITEQQPQLFVTPDFDNLSKVLHEFSEKMAFKRGGIYGLQAAQQAKTINTVELDSGLQLSGILSDIMLSPDNDPIFIKFNDPTQISFSGHQLEGHGKEYHKHGYSTPLGPVRGVHLNNASEDELKRLNLFRGQKTQLHFDSGITLTGTVSELNFKKNRLILVSFMNCRVTYKDTTLFDPEWGAFDLSIGSKVISVFGGPADRESYGIFGDFVATRVPKKKISAKKLELYNFYQTIRDDRNDPESNNLDMIYDDYFENFSDHWLPGLEIFELFYINHPSHSKAEVLEKHLRELTHKDETTHICITKGLGLIKQEFGSRAVTAPSQCL